MLIHTRINKSNEFKMRDDPPDLMLNAKNTAYYYIL